MLRAFLTTIACACAYALPGAGQAVAATASDSHVQRGLAQAGAVFRGALINDKEFETLPRRLANAQEAYLPSQSRFLDNNCAGTLEREKEKNKEGGGNFEFVYEASQETRRTGKTAQYVDFSQERVFSRLAQVHNRDQTLIVTLEEFRADPEYTGEVIDVIEKRSYPTLGAGFGILMHGLTLGISLVDKSVRESTFGCQTRRLLAQVIDPTRAKPTGRFGLQAVHGNHSFAIRGLGPELSATGIINGRGEILIDDDKLMNAPVKGSTRLRVVCQSCERADVFGAPVASDTSQEIDLDLSGPRRAALSRKLHAFFRAPLTESAIDQLIQWGLDTERKISGKHDQMRAANLGYNLAAEGFFEFVADERQAQALGKTLREVRDARIQAQRDKLAAQQAEAQRAQAERNQRIAQEFPFEAYIECGFAGEHLNIALCMNHNGINTHFEIRNGETYGRFSVHDVRRLGPEQYRVGLQVRLRRNFSVALQNASPEFLLTFSIYDVVSKRPLYKKSAARFEVLAVSDRDIRPSPLTEPINRLSPPRQEATGRLSLMSQVLGKKWGLPGLPCDLHGGSYEVFHRDRGLVFTAGGQERIGGAANTFEFSDRGADRFFYKQTFFANDLVARSLRDPQAVSTVIETEVSRISDTQIRLKKKITQLDFEQMLAGVKRYTSKEEVVERHLCPAR